MEVRGQPYALAALLAPKNPGRRLGGPHSQHEHFRIEKILLRCKLILWPILKIMRPRICKVLNTKRYKTSRAELEVVRCLCICRVRTVLSEYTTQRRVVRSYVNAIPLQTWTGP